MKVLLALLLIAAFGLLGRMETEDMEAHARWMAEAREQGAWVMF